MGLLDEILGEKGSELVGALVQQANFSPSEAQGFLPPAAGEMLEAVKGGGVDIGALIGGGGISELLSKIDIGALAAQTGVDGAKATSGLEALLPPLLSALQDQAGGLDGILALLGGSKGGALSALGGLAGKLFGR